MKLSKLATVLLGTAALVGSTISMAAGKLDIGQREYDDYGYEADVFVRARILAVIDYLYRLQVK